jgi:hypothetical protein
MLNKPAGNVGPVCSTATRYCTVVAVVVDHVAGERSRLGQELIERIRSDLPASIFGSGLIGAELRMLGRVYAEDADVHAVDLDRVAVDHTGTAYQNRETFSSRVQAQGCVERNDADANATPY